VLDFGRGQGTAPWDVDRFAPGMVGRPFRTIATRHIEDVELAAGGGLDGVLDGGVVGDVVSVHDILHDHYY